MENIMNSVIPKNYCGYMLLNIYDLFGEPLGVDSMKKFQRIPRKISAFINKEKIKAVFKYDLKEVKHQYFVKFIDNSWKELEY